VSCSKASSLSASDCLAPTGSSLFSRIQLLFLLIAFVTVFSFDGYHLIIASVISQGVYLINLVDLF
ncbi:MAG: hypothetical protein SPK58_12305, partial [Lachnospiraceae bacterium]|nr:hypothetical protein [Lachnospiraceae bacterium]